VTDEVKDLIRDKKADNARWFREKAMGYRKTAADNRELAASMLKRADELEERAARHDAAADALELEVTGAW
jgi:hypothetical protein